MRTELHANNDLASEVYAINDAVMDEHHHYGEEVHSERSWATPTYSEAARPVLSVLDRIGVGYLVLDRHGAISESNRAAQASLSGQELFGDAAKRISTAVRRAISENKAGSGQGSMWWVVIPCKGGKPVIVTESPNVTQDGTSIVVLLDREAKPEPNPQTLKKIFGLTGAETELAIRLAQGDAPLDVARHRRLSRTTIRSQLASLFQKTETNRQAELVALLGRVALLP